MNNYSEKLRTYIREGEKAAMALPNRGPIQFESNGNVASEILEGYAKYGFYVLENFLDKKDLQDWQDDFDTMKANYPETSEAKVDLYGRPALGVDAKGPALFWAKPLSDPLGGTKHSGGRYAVRMSEPLADESLPEEIVYMIMGPLRYSEALLRITGHPHLLAIAEAIFGDDFVPFNEALWIKEAGLGSSTAWHQDGVTHWDHPQWDKDIHGMTFQVQLHGCSGANGLWVLPGSHTHGKIDIKQLVEEAGSDRIIGAVPYLCGPGDVVMHNRQLLHGSFANTSDKDRVSLTFGFNRRSSILNVEAGLHNKNAVYDEARILERSRMIGYAIDARRQHFPDETSYDYKPLSGLYHKVVWSEAVKASLRNYNLLDLSI